MNYAKFVNENTAITTKVCDLFEANNLSARDGELILLWLAGLSLGRRQASLTKQSEYLTMLALGWQVGAGDDSDD